MQTMTVDCSCHKKSHKGTKTINPTRLNPDLFNLDNVDSVLIWIEPPAGGFTLFQRFPFPADMQILNKNIVAIRVHTNSTLSAVPGSKTGSQVIDRLDLNKFIFTLQDANGRRIMADCPIQVPDQSNCDGELFTAPLRINPLKSYIQQTAALSQNIGSVVFQFYFVR